MARSPYVVPCVMKTSETLTRGLHHVEQAYLREGEPKSRSKNDAKESQPAETQFDSSWEAVEWSSDEGAPHCGNRPAYDRARDKPESNDPKVE